MSTTAYLPSKVDVVIVGAGPTGLTAACFLQKAGVSTVVLDAAPTPATTSRASVIHLRTLEILEQLDLADSIIQQGLPVTEMTLYEKESLLTGLDFTSLHERYKHAVALPQTETERTLTLKLEHLGGTIHRDCAVVGLLQIDDAHVHLRIKHNAEPTAQVLSARYAIAADGLHSTLRQSLDIPFEGSQYALSFVTADVHMDPSVWPHQNLRNKVNLYLKPGSGFLLVVPFPSSQDDLWRIIATVDVAPKDPDKAYLDDLVRSRGPKMANVAVVTDVVWGSHFRINHRLAQRYRKGRIFLAGDAAHTHSPAGGQGMNTGMQDADCLAAVLTDALLSGKDDEEDLDQYEKTRRPVAEGVVALTHRLTLATTVTNPWLAWARNRLMWLLPKIVPGLQRYISWRVSELEH